jgi:2-polyprenyl-6-methoxyphenol hydroxylase-like FAD-dependent oxidoreductase
MFQSNPQVLIAGAGPVGLFAALALARKGVKVEIVDSGVWTVKHSYALALHPQTLELLEPYGLASKLLEQSYPVKTLGFYDTAGRKAAVNIPGTLAVVRQDLLEELLEKALNEAGVKVSWRHEVFSLTPGADRVEARINKLEKESRGYIVAHTEWVVAKAWDIQADFVIGADGYSSRVRRTLDIGFPEVAPASYYAVFECGLDGDLDNETRVVFTEDSSNVLWPLPGGTCRWSFQLPGYTDPDAEQVKDHLLQSGFGYFPTERFKDRTVTAGVSPDVVLSDESLAAFIKERAPWFKGKITSINWRTLIRFERRLADRFGAGRMALAGDAAHLAGPVGIQSMNIGMFEAASLANAIVANLGGGKSLAALDEYNTHWTDSWRQLQGLTGGLKPAAGADAWVTGKADRILSCLPGHGDALDAMAAQLNLAL